MSARNVIDVIIDGKIYTLSGFESESYLQKVASYINAKIIDFKKDDGYRRQTLDVQKTLLEINIADDYFKAKKQADMLEADLEEKDKQLYDLKHELINANVKVDALIKENEEIKQQIIEYQKDIVRYQTELKDK
ncbi:MAG: cell division protein ZapA [Eubacterium sp.]